MLELKCTDCGNDLSFIEFTTSEWYVDESGEREEKISEKTEYICRRCRKLVKISQQTINGVSK